MQSAQRLEIVPWKNIQLSNIFAGKKSHGKARTRDRKRGQAQVSPRLCRCRQKHPVNDVRLQNGTSKFKVVKLFLLPGLVPCGTARAFVWSAHPWLVDVWLVGAGTLLQGPWPHLSPIYSFRVAIPQHLTTCGFFWGADSGKNRAQYTASPYATLRGDVSAKIKRIDCFLESASFIGCQANKALVAETSAVQQTGREKTWQKSAEWRSKTGRLKT